MMSFAERNPLMMGGVGVMLVLGLTAAALNYDKLPFVDNTSDHTAYFAEAGGLTAGSPVQVAGVRVGQVSSIELDGPQVRVEFSVDRNIHLGNRTEAAIKTKSLLGAKLLEVTPRGEGRQSDPIPVDRTISAYQLPDALGDLTATISGLDTNQLSESLAVLADTFSGTPPDVKVAVQGVARFSETLNKRDEQLRSLLSNAEKATRVLAERADQVVILIANSNALLAELQTQSNALDQISANVSAVSAQIKGFITDNRDSFKPAVDKLNKVLAIVDERKGEVQKAIAGLVAYATALGESVSSGPFFKAYIANLLPGQFLQPFIDAAFSDLGLDPNVLAPSVLTDPQVGQPATPALPSPFPRTGQGGDPRMTLPDAITGNPGDPRYPYREPPQAPAPGGPPPGPPAAEVPPNQPSVPTPPGVFAPAPNESTPTEGDR